VAAAVNTCSAAVLRRRSPRSERLTPYARLGDTPFVSLAVALLLADPLTVAARSRARVGQAAP